MKSLQHFCQKLQKMKYSKFLVLFAITGSFVLNACTDEVKKPDLTNTQKLAGHPWLLIGATFNPPLVTTIGTQNFTFYELFDIPLIDSCQKDNLIIFNADSTMTIDNGVLKCGSEPQTAKDGNWKFTDSETKIEITNSAYFSLINANKVILENVTVAETEMKGQTDYIFINPITQVQTTSKINFTFKRK